MNEEVENQRKKYLLILSCSKRKKKISNIRAIDLYDGPFYRMIRKNKPEGLDILILSAKYGLIRGDEKISYYEQIMSSKRAQELASDISAKLEKELKNSYYDSVVINLGKTYALALWKCKEILNEHNVRWINGQIGERLHELKNWLVEIDMERGRL
jgi:cytoplasmic iron level regulating protein YaaA (DUF328/UPF0246 family)